MSATSGAIAATSSRKPSNGRTGRLRQLALAFRSSSAHVHVHLLILRV